jgi:hypothetical protein
MYVVSIKAATLKEALGNLEAELIGHAVHVIAAGTLEPHKMAAATAYESAAHCVKMLRFKYAYEIERAS